MAPGLLLNLLLLFLLFITPASPGPQPLEVTAVTGGVTLLNPPTPLNPQNYSRIHWRWKNQVTIASRGRGEGPRYPQKHFGGRLELLDNHTLKMCHLELGDSGRYQLYLEDGDGRETVLEVLLKVYDIVPKPQVTATTTDDDPRRCQATLNCSVSLPGVTYTWFLPREPRVSEGHLLTVTPDTDGDTFVCRVTNAVSSSNASLTYRQPCTWTDESSSSVTCATPSAAVAFILLFLLLAVA
ncbi:CD48 antigen-like [Sylvia borin]